MLNLRDELNDKRIALAATRKLRRAVEDDRPPRDQRRGGVAP